MYKSWLKELPAHLKEEDLDEIRLLFEMMIDPGLDFIRHNATEISPTQDQNLVMNCMRLFRSLIKDFEDVEAYEMLTDLK